MSTFFGYKSYADYRAAFSRRATARGIDRETGATTYQALLVTADQQVATHNARARAAVWTNADLPSGWQRYGGIGSRIEMMARPDWWRDRTFWKGRCAATTRASVALGVIRLHGLILPPDVEALVEIRTQIGGEAPKQIAEIFGEVWRETLAQPPLHVQAQVALHPAL